MNIGPSWSFRPSPQLAVCTKATDQMGWRGQLKRIKYEIRLGEPNGSMSMGQKKVEPILCVESLTKRRPKLVHHVSDSWRLALQENVLGCKDKTCPTRKRLVLQGKGLSYKDKTCSTRKKLGLQGKEARPHYYKSPQHPPHKKRTRNWFLSSTLEL